MFRLRRFFPILFILSLSLWAQEDFYLPVPLYVDGEYFGEIPLKINGKVLLQPRALLDMLSPLLDEEKRETGMNRWEEEDWVPYESMAGSLIQVDFDEANILLEVVVPPESRRPAYYSLYRDPAVPKGKIIRPADLSGVLNMEGWTRLDYETDTFRYRLGPDLSVNYLGNLLETKGGVQSEGDPLFLDYARMLRDLPVLSARAEAGDLTYTAGGFLKKSMVGLSLFRQTALDEKYRPVPELPQTIFFPEPAEVEILINERSIRRESVPAGTWTFRNFPLIQGPNEVVIKWKDSQGEHRESFFQLYDGNLLKKDEADWGISMGTDSWTSLNPALFFHYSFGLSHTFTTGLSTYYDWNNSLFSLETPVMLATGAGNIQFTPAVDMALKEGYSLSLILNHSYSEKRKDRARYSFGSSWSLRQQSFPVELTRYSLRTYYVYSPLSDLSFTPSANWSYEAVQQSQTLGFSVRVRKGSRDGSSVSADLGVTYDKGEWKPKASLTYTASFPEIYQNFYARADLSGQKMNLAWNRYSRTDASSDYTLGASAVVPAQNDERFTLNMNGGYLHPAFRFNVAQGFNAFLAEGEYNNSTTLSGGTALAYADGTLGWSRPFRSSFAMIESEIGPLDINPTSRGSLLHVEQGSPGVLTSLSPYRYTTLKMQPENLPVGSDINDYTLSVYPTYRSGALILAEEKVFMYAGGILLGRNGKPRPLLTGQIQPLLPGESAAADRASREFFTDEEGYFECYGLIPGEYRLIQKDLGLTYIVEVTMDSSGYCSLGEVTPED